MPASNNGHHDQVISVACKARLQAYEVSER